MKAISEIEAKNFALMAVNPNAKVEEDAQTPKELLDFIELNRSRGDNSPIPVKEMGVTKKLTFVTSILKFLKNS